MASKDNKRITIKLQSDTAGGLEQLAKAEKAGAKIRKTKTGVADVTSSGGTRNVDFIYRDIETLKVLQNINQETIAANRVKPKKSAPMQYDLVDSINKDLTKQFNFLPKKWFDINPKVLLRKNATPEEIKGAQEALKTAEKTALSRETRNRRTIMADKAQAKAAAESALNYKKNLKLYLRDYKYKTNLLKKAADEEAKNIEKNKKLSAKQYRDNLKRALRNYKYQAQMDRKRLAAAENVRKADHKKQMTRFKTRSSTLRGLSTMSLSANMSMLGIMFSFMSLFTMVSGLFGGLLAAAANLSGAVTGGALSSAFLSPEALGLGTRINPETGKEEKIGIERDQMDVAGLVEGYKKSIAVQGEMTYLFAKFASDILNDTEFMTAIVDSLKELAKTFSDPEFLRQVIKAAKSFIDMAPDLMNAVKGLLDLTAMIMPWLQMFLPLILSSVILLPLLSLFNAIFGVVMMGFALSNDLLAAILLRTEAARLATAAGGVAQGLGVGTAAAAGAGGSGILGGLLGGLSFAAIKEGILGAFLAVFEAGALVTGFAIMVGAILGLIGVGIFDALGILDWVGELGKAFGDWLGGSDFGQWIKNVLVVLTSPLLILGAIVVGLVEGGIGGAITKVWDAVYLIDTALQNIFTGILDTLILPLIWLLDSIIKGIDRAISNMGENVFTKGISDLFGLGWFATGGYVSNTGLAMVHEGEYISNTSQPTSNGNITQEVNITVYGDLDSKAADKVVDELINQQRYSSWS